MATIFLIGSGLVLLLMLSTNRNRPPHFPQLPPDYYDPQRYYHPMPPVQPYYPHPYHTPMPHTTDSTALFATLIFVLGLMFFLWMAQ